ncbi:MAG: hypothetical protein NVS9B10_26320 [Nevskia sp.]
MPAMSRSIFTTRPKVAPISTRISQELFDRVQAIQSQLKRLDSDAVFPIEQIVEDALQKAVKLADAELAKRSATAVGQVGR